MSTGHGRQTPAKGIHNPIAWHFANATDRGTFTLVGGTKGNPTSAAALTAGDIDRWALDEDTGLLFRLLSIGPPTWGPVGGGGTGGGAGHLESLSWTFDPASAADADPGAGNTRFDNLTQASATQMFISDTADNGADQRATILRLHKGQHFTLQEVATAANYHVCEVTGDPVGAAGYVKVPITVIDSGTDLTANLCGWAPQYSDIVHGSIALVRTANVTLSTGGPVQILYDTTLVQNSDWFSVASSEVTILKSARFRITQEITAAIQSGTVTCLATIQLYEDTGGGFVAIPEAIAESRAHNSSTPEQHVHLSILRDFSAGDIIRGYEHQAFGTAVTDSLGNHNRLTIAVQEAL